TILDQCLRLLHPFTPFVTEELWGHLKNAAKTHSSQFSPKGDWPDALIIAPWPEPRQLEGWEDQTISQFAIIQDVIRAIRNIRSEKGIPLGTKLSAIIISQQNYDLINNQLELIARLANLDHHKILLMKEMPEKPTDKIPLIIGEVEIFLDAQNTVNHSQELTRLQKDLEEINQQIQRLNLLLNSEFSQKAPPHVVEKERQKLEDFNIAAEKIKKQIRELEG
ncbi:MAG: class I tRNA ligase family protein, partial [Anaerolineales bacterium]